MHKHFADRLYAYSKVSLASPSSIRAENMEKGIKMRRSGSQAQRRHKETRRTFVGQVLKLVKVHNGTFVSGFRPNGNHDAPVLARGRRIYPRSDKPVE